ncbi:HNH endonuclease [Mesorhizobium sp. M7A.F.Ca.AU.002.06.1.1]|uniref:HNH endonuclease n=1 Tax=Mesorhizobium ciceri TaxID=39645 RepID=UPI000FCC3996|nr:HNH endonuclease [Mesorhizobium sp. Primo-B]RUU37877.1 HNH endonuclease [Mesorhizobium sp. Primo-A]RVB69318.1 HNH endonuclease [Mesorhizobium sp. M7A.F.Ca.CA.002.03.2.1]RVB90966.1 HNH endonuclease [Mesorhizobium sp. M7A.F.Ca.AU.002.03.1.1]RVB95916.1 HNH endonuclease [Mesorhizobium sp. M7A.F.Ca.AU.002.04.1.1]RVC05739.1 HNH endonuclease [Mesorhizobium sp. M7A.F.Ca.AU.002.06.1.1]RVC18736.1 HNH endonuclease [Mesorhizobium sp. M7A.F.Ca.AU.001.01.1.1]RVC22327.1 HNH endonuclease [Mesorhizobium s
MGDSKTIQLNCQHCDKSFVRYRSQIKKGNHKFCGQECKRGAAGGSWLVCVGCGGDTYRKRYQAEKIEASGANVYCSRGCQSKHKTFSRTCKNCNLSFSKPTSQAVGLNRDSLCSIQCKEAFDYMETKCSWPGCSETFRTRIQRKTTRGVEGQYFRTDFNGTMRLSWRPICEFHHNLCSQYVGGHYRANGRLKWFDDPEINLGSRGVNQPITRLLIFAKTDGKCSHCDRSLDFNGGHSEWHIDHTIPVYKGGKTNYPNLQPLCRICHDVKTSVEKSEVGRLRHKMTKLGRWLTHTEKDELIAELRREIDVLRASANKEKELGACLRKSASTKSSRSAKTLDQMSLRL